MIRPSDLTGTQVLRVTTITPVWTGETRSAASWFDSSSPTQIVGQVSIDSRSLSVEEHTVRVLTHLIGERDVEA